MLAVNSLKYSVFGTDDGYVKPSLMSCFMEAIIS